LFDVKGSWEILMKSPQRWRQIDVGRLKSAILMGNPLNISLYLRNGAR